jgi:hypothetical protein
MGSKKPSSRNCLPIPSFWCYRKVAIIRIRHASGLCTAFPRLVRARLASALDVELGAVQQSPSAVHNPSSQSLEKGEHILGWAKAQRLDRWRLQGAKGPLLHREICLHIDVRGLDAFMTEPQGND